MHPRWAVNWPDLLLHFTLFFFPLCSPAIHHCFSSSIPQFSHHLPPPCLPPTLLALHHHALLLILFPSFLNIFYVMCLPLPPSDPPSIIVFLAALLPSYYIKWSLPIGKGSISLDTRSHSSIFLLPAWELRPFNSSPARTGGGNPLGHLYWHLVQRTKT